MGQDTILIDLLDEKDGKVLDSVQIIAIFTSVDLQIKAAFDPDSEFKNPDIQQKIPAGDQIEQIDPPLGAVGKFDVKIISKNGQTSFLKALDDAACTFDERSYQLQHDSSI